MSTPKKGRPPKWIGATAIEYGLIAAGIAVAIIVAVNAVGTDLNLAGSLPSSTRPANSLE